MAASCGEPAERPTAGSDDIVLGLVASFGRNQQARNGAVLAADEINATGGVVVDGQGRRVELIAEDDEGRPETAVSKALKLINRDRALALLGVPRSSNAIPVSKLAEQYRVPMLSTMSTNPETTAGKRYVFRLAFLDSFQGEALAKFAVDDLEVRRAAVLYDIADPYTTYLVEVFSEAFRARGGRLVAVETFTDDDTDLTDLLLRIAESGADVLFLPQGPGAAALARVARQAGFGGTFLGADTWSFGIAPADRHEFGGSYFSDLWAPDIPDGSTRAFIDRYRGAFGILPSASAALSYDAVSIVARVIAEHGAESEAVRAGLSSLGDYHGVSGTIAFRGSNDPVRSVYIRAIETGGSVRLEKEIRP